MSGMDMMISSVMKALKLDPEQVKTAIANVTQIAVNSKSQFERIEANQILILENQAAIMAALKIEPSQYVQKEISHG